MFNLTRQYPTTTSLFVCDVTILVSKWRQGSHRRD